MAGGTPSAGEKEAKANIDLLLALLHLPGWWERWMCTGQRHTRNSQRNISVEVTGEVVQGIRRLGGLQASERPSPRGREGEGA